MKKLLIFLLFIAIPLGGTWAWARFMIPWEDYIAQTKASFEASGHYIVHSPITIEAISLLPTPTISLGKLSVTPATGKQGVELTTNNVTVLFNVQSWLEGNALPIDRMVLHNANISQQSSQFTDIFSTLSTLPIAIELRNSQWSSQDTSTEMSNINLTLRPVGTDGGSHINGSVRIKDRTVNVEWFMHANPATMPAKVAGSFSDKHHTLGLKGSLTQKGKAWQYHGHSIFKSTNTANALHLFPSMNAWLGTDDAALSLIDKSELTGQLTIRPDGIALTDATLSIENIGSANTAYLYKKAQQSHQIKLNADTLSLSKDAATFAQYIHTQWANYQQDNFNKAQTRTSRLHTKLVDSRKFSRLFPEDWNISLHLDAAQVQWQTKPISNISMLAELHSSNWTVQHLRATLPGNTASQTLGVLKQTDKGWEYDGSLEWKSQHIRQALELLGAPVHSISNQATLKASSGRGGISISPKHFRLSENNFTLDGQRGKFSSIYHFQSTKHPKGLLDTAISMQKTNLDAYLPNHPWLTWFREREFDKSIDLTAAFPAWLNSVPTDIHLRLFSNIAKLRHLPWKHVRADCFVKDQTIGCKEFSAHLRSQPLKARFALKRAAPRPNFSLTLDATGMTSADVMTVLEGSPQPMATYTPQKEWSDTPYSMDLWNIANSKLAITIGKLFFTDNLSMEQFKLNASSKKSLWNVKTLEANMLGGHAAFSGNISSGKLPSIHGDFSMTGMDVAKLTALKTPLPALSGNISVAGSLSGEGYSPLRLVQNLNANMQFSSGNMVASPLDINGMSRKLSYVRSVDDVVNFSRIALSDGTTRFSNISGNASLKSGILSIPKATHSTSSASGHLRGVIDIRDLQMNTELSFQLKSQIGGNVPAVALTLQGDLPTPTRELDTRALENHTAKQQVR